MAETRIGGVVVASGATIYWAAIARIAVASWIYSGILGIISVIREIRLGIASVTVGYTGFIVTLISRVLDGLTVAIQAAFYELLGSVDGFGPFAFPIVVGVVVLVIVIIARGIQW